MNLRQQTQAALNVYLETFPAEKESLKALASQLLTDTADVFDRKNMLGHVTTSAFVIDPAARKVLLIHHKLYDRWLQPGGHYESQPGATDSLAASALREVVEETGILDLRLYPWLLAHDVPLDIDTHAIGAQPKKDEGTHVHHDFVFLVAADSTQRLIPQLCEVFGAKWLTYDEVWALNVPRLCRILQKIA